MAQQAAVTTNKNIIMSSFKSSRDIQKKEGEPPTSRLFLHKNFVVDSDEHPEHRFIWTIDKKYHQISNTNLIDLFRGVPAIYVLEKKYDEHV